MTAEPTGTASHDEADHSPEMWGKVVEVYRAFDTVIDYVGGTFVQPISRLYHYTTAEATLSIIRSGVLRASDIRFLNDTSEVEHSYARFKELLDLFDLTAGDEGAIAKIARLKNIMDVQTVRPIFVSCLSAARDQLSQWRGYAPRGFALGFEFDALSFAGDEVGYLFLPVVYDIEKQHRVVELIVNIAMVELSKSDEWELTPAECELAFRVAFEIVVLTFAPFLKNDRFSEELEWRLVSTPMHRKKLSAGYRTLGRYLVQYEEIPLATGKWSALAEVIVGPPRGDSAVIRGLESALSYYEYANTMVAETKIPLRHT